MRRAAQVIIDELDELTRLLSREQGKPRNESYMMELLPTIDSLHWIAEAGPEASWPTSASRCPLFLKQKRARFTYEPLGRGRRDRAVELPLVDPFGEVAIALMSGNGVVLKPASLTPLIGQRIQEVFERAGCPRAWFARSTAAGRSGRRWSSRARRRSSSPARWRSGGGSAWSAPSA